MLYCVVTRYKEGALPMARMVLVVSKRVKLLPIPWLPRSVPSPCRADAMRKWLRIAHGRLDSWRDLDSHSAATPRHRRIP